MRPSRIESTFYICFFLIGIMFIMSPITYAQDAKTMLKQVNKELRQAQKNMFSGKNEKATASLEGIQTLLNKIKEADPNNNSLKSAERKFRKLVKDLERKTGKDLGGGSLTASGSSTKPALPTKPQAKAIPEKPEETSSVQPGQVKKTSAGAKLPYDARRPISNAKQSLERIDRNLGRLKGSGFNPDQVLKNMETALESARKSLEQGKAKAAEKGVTSHPDFGEIEEGIAQAEKKIADARTGHEKAQKETSAKQGEVQADVKALKDEYDRVRDVFDRATGNVFHYNDLKTVKEVLSKIEVFEKNDLASIQAKMASFEKKYGSTRDEIDKKADSMGYIDNYNRASYAYTELDKGIKNIKKTRTVMADDLIRRAKDMQGNAKKGASDFYRVKQHVVIKEWGRTAAAYDPKNPRVKEFNGGLDAWIQKDLRDLNAKVDKATFPGQGADAPKDVKMLSKTAKEFLQKEEDKNKAQGKTYGKILAVSVTGPWRIFKKNILAEPIQYNLPVAVSVQIESEKSMNLVRVYLMTMLTQEMKGVKKAPPFIGATVGNSYYVRPSAVK